MKERFAKFNKWRKQAYITDNETIVLYNLLVYLSLINLVLRLVIG